MNKQTIEQAPLNFSPGKRLDWYSLAGDSPALMLAKLAQTHQGVIVLITPDMQTAGQLQSNLEFFLEDSNIPIYPFPDWEILPYDHFSPHQDIISQRLSTLYQLPQAQQGILVLPLSTLTQRLAPQSYIQSHSLILQQGQKIDFDKLSQQLQQAGYRRVEQVSEHGEYTLRGGSLLDLYPMGSKQPYRIDLFDDEIETLHTFDPETQRRGKQALTEIKLLPAREYPLTTESIALFKQNWLDSFPNDKLQSSLYKDVCKAIPSAGLEFYTPLFFQQTHSLFDYLGDNALCFTLGNLHDKMQQHWHSILERYEQLRHDIQQPILEPQRLFLSVEQLFQQLKQQSYIRLHPDNSDNQQRLHFNAQPAPDFKLNHRQKNPLAPVQDYLTEPQRRVLFCAESNGRREALIELLAKYSIYPQRLNSFADFQNQQIDLAITIAPLDQGFSYQQNNIEIVLITENQLFGERVAQRRLREKNNGAQDNIIRHLDELKIGDAIVHEEHGVGRYLGLTTLKIDELSTEFLQLEYAKQAKLYVPITSLHLIGRFGGVDPEHAPLHQLGNKQWQKAKQKAAKRAYDVAAELLDIHARRAARQGHAFKLDPLEYQNFAQSFPFEETPDQAQAIQAVLKDMQQVKPMDRLVCGDVGFGKTEVAMRAAFVAAQAGHQVAILVPTTLLAQQHYETFSDRFADWALKVALLSRFRTSKQQTETLKALETGEIDIIVGTHKLLQNSVKFKRLGLIIIDEEHRFGVKQKERFKALRAELDILTLTATPIPRSLNMAMSDLRDLSIIATPPSRRLAINTFICQWQNDILREAMQRELQRGGQIYFLHNKVDSIEKIAREVRELMPDARVGVAHGQMPERQLEQVMQDFYHRHHHILVCTTIIETGIDIPTANTIIIDRADKLGLAQLYQLRGRVGRSHHRAYAYLIAPPKRSISKDAQKRLEVISQLEELGVGFTLATHDLEIRGAGEFLGEEQSGHMQEIGFSLYTDLLERAVSALKQGKDPALERPLDHGTEIDLQVSALLPDDYVHDVHTRLNLYKRIASAANADSLRDLKIELIDRFGLLPDIAKNLFAITALKFKTTALGINKISLGDQGGKLQFNEKPPIDPMRLIQFIQKYPAQYRLDQQQNIHIHKDLKDIHARIQIIENFISAIQS